MYFCHLLVFSLTYLSEAVLITSCLHQIFPVFVPLVLRFFGFYGSTWNIPAEETLKNW